MEKVIKYRCNHCGDLFDSEEICLEHEDRHERIYKANQMLKDGCTLKEIQDECNIWYNVPDYLENITTDNCFMVSHWQCCNQPAYRIIAIYMDGRVMPWGCGSWDGYYDNKVDLSAPELRSPRPKEELFIDKRYGTIYG